MTDTLEFEFEELPLIIRDGAEYGLMTGIADIAYFDQGEWSITGIYLEGYRKPTEAERQADLAKGMKYPRSHIRIHTRLDAGDPAYSAIYHRLEHEWSDRVEQAVADAISHQSQYARDYCDRERA